MEAQIQRPWTFKEFKWQEEPFQKETYNLFRRGNDYITKQWSHNFFIYTKENVHLLLQSLGNSLSSLKDACILSGQRCTSLSKALQHGANSFLIAGQLFVSIEILNPLKAIIGIAISVTKLTYHTLKGVGALLSIVYYKEGATQLGFAVKDTLSITACIGNMIPFWLAPGILLFCPPAGALLAVVKGLTEFTGISDLVGYSSTGALLYLDYKVATYNGDESEEAIRTKQAWDHLKEELHPKNSFEGALLSSFSVHVFVESIACTLNAFLPAFKPIVKIGKIALQAIGVASLLAYREYHKRKDQHHEDVDPRSTSQFSLQRLAVAS